MERPHDVTSAQLPSNPLLRRILWTVLIVTVFGLMVLFAYQSFRNTQNCSPLTELPKYHQIPDFTLTERSGQVFSKSDLAGKIWVANFIFTSCHGPCPIISSRFQELQSMLDRTENVRLVSFSVDPATDTPEVLTNYSKRFLANPDRWVFLTGEPAPMHKLIIEGFLLPVTENPTDKVDLYGRYLHSSKLLLIDGTGTVRGIYDGIPAESVPHILKDIGFLMREKNMK
jgi:protein SCO1